MMTESNASPHQCAWFMIGLLFAQGYPPGTFPTDNDKLMRHGVACISEMLDTCAMVSLHGGWSGGVS